MSHITEAHNVKAGDWIVPEGKEYPSEVAKVTHSNRITDPWTGQLRYTKRRFYFTAALNAPHGAEYNSDTLVVVY